MIGQVDAVLIATDDGADHVRRARPFVEANLPVFIDKPMATTLEELRQFIQWERAGARLLSSSGMRYAPELARLDADRTALGELRWMSFVTAKTWSATASTSLSLRSSCSVPASSPSAWKAARASRWRTSCTAAGCR